MENLNVRFNGCIEVNDVVIGRIEEYAGEYLFVPKNCYQDLANLPTEEDIADHIASNLDFFLDIACLLNPNVIEFAYQEGVIDLRMEISFNNWVTVELEDIYDEEQENPSKAFTAHNKLFFYKEDYTTAPKLVEIIPA